MPYTDPGAVTTGTTITSTWGNAVRNAEQYLANPPACRVYHNAAQSHTTGTEISLAFNSERFDTDSMHDPVTNNSRITFTTAGLYQITGCLEWTANTTGLRYAVIRLNGVTNLCVVTNNASSSLTTDIVVSTLWKAAAGDYVELRAWQNSGATLNIAAGIASTPEFMAVWVGLG